MTVLYPSVLTSVPSGVIKAMSVFVETYREAVTDGHSVDRTGLAVAGLHRRGIDPSAIDWLLGRGYVRPVAEPAPSPYHPPGNGSNGYVTGGPRLVLTEVGGQMIEILLRCQLGPEPALAGPYWDAARRELRVGTVVVKQFVREARNQIAILAAFHQRGWPEVIGNPLDSGSETSGEERLANAVKELNRTRNALRVMFHVRGGGTAVRWEIIDETRARKPGSRNDL